GDQVATHADVANYFCLRERTARHSVSARPLTPPAHHSSLSALVAPVQPVAATEPSPSQPFDPESPAPAPAPRASRPLWAIAGISCLISALGVSAVARYKSHDGAPHSAAQSAPPPLATAAPAAAPLPNPPPPPSAVPPPVELAPQAPALPPPPDRRDKPSKSPKAPNASKGLAPKLRLPAKAARSPDHTAAKYGI